MSNETQIARIEGRIDKSVSANTGLTSTGAMAFSSVEQIMEFAKVMAIAGVAVPKHLRENVGACLAVAIQASEWQMSPFAVASKTYVVNDRIGFEAQLVNAVILRRAPIVGRFKITYTGEGQNRRCRVAAKLTDGDEVDYESPILGAIPVKNSPLWKGDPDQQLFYYSSRAMCRRHFPDVLLGVYTPDELADEVGMKSVSGTEISPGKVGSQETPFTMLPQRPKEAEPKQEAAPTPEPEPAPIEPAAPEAEDTAAADKLRVQIKTLCRADGISRALLIEKLAEKGILSDEDPEANLEVASAEQLQQIVNDWQYIKAFVLAK